MVKELYRYLILIIRTIPKANVYISAAIRLGEISPQTGVNHLLSRSRLSVHCNIKTRMQTKKRNSIIKRATMGGMFLGKESHPYLKIVFEPIFVGFAIEA